jgi:8-oxo-dGTP pyrophosphatase MutT (NUDIX family)
VAPPGRGELTSAADLVGSSKWFAGVHVVEDGRLLLTVAGENPEIPGPPPPRAHVRWIGGGSLPGESYLECAEREALEELGCEVEVLHTGETIVELKPDPPERVELEDRPAPLLVQRYLDGIVLVIYRARPLGDPRPADVERLAWVPLCAVEALPNGVLPADLHAHGIQLLGPPPPPDARLFIGRAGAEYLLCRLGVDA